MVVTYLVEHAPASVANHRNYAFAHGYPHTVIDMSQGPRGPQLQALNRYECLLAALGRVAAGGLVLLLDENAAIVHPVALPALMDGRDCLLVATSAPAPQPGFQVWRNTPQSRERVATLIGQCRLGGPAFAGEAPLLAGLPALRWHDTIGEICALMHTGPNVDPRWSIVPTFAVCLEAGSHSPPELGIVPRFRHALFDHVNDCQLHARQPFMSGATHDHARPARETFNAGHRIALVTLYTPQIASYGRIAERSMRRYCDRHGYTLHVHRDIPPEIGLPGTGNWLKPWLLHAYLAHHEWVVWLDADVLVANADQPLEPLLEGRERVFARDIGQWPLNSGVMAFRHTGANLAVLADLMQRIAALPDRSTVYACNGDQFHFIAALRAHGLLDDAQVDSPLTLNTPWFMRTPDSFIVHYFGMWTEMRALMMHHDDSGGARKALARQSAQGST
ncbi:hypothetical protein JCM10599A_66510 [Paraburkholderia kururiensis]